MRSVSISNRHPRLKINRRGITRAIEILDQQFRFAPADLATLNVTARTRARAQAGAIKKKLTVESAVAPGELSLVFLTDSALAELHSQFLDDPSITDVITFEGNELMESAGEICVSADTAARYAAATTRDFAEELTLYLIHGWLHLAGYDDLKPVRKRRMRAAEARAIALLRAESALPPFTFKKR